MKPRMPCWSYLTSIELAILCVFYPSMTTWNLIEVFVVSVAQLIGSYKGTGLGIAEGLEVSPVTGEASLSDEADCSCERHGERYEGYKGKVVEVGLLTANSNHPNARFRSELPLQLSQFEIDQPTILGLPSISP